jgi:predicted nicotinamide N-methyase
MVMKASILEIGSGTGLPSIMSKLMNAKMVITTERDSEPFLLDNLKRTMTLNGLKSELVVTDCY